MPTDDLELSTRLEKNTMGDLDTLEIVSVSKQIQKLKTNNGNVLICNAHVSPGKKQMITFPDIVDDLYDDYAELMYKISSRIPDELLVRGKEYGFNLKEGAKFFVFNAEISTLLKFVKFGTAATGMSKLPDDDDDTRKLT